MGVANKVLATDILEQDVIMKDSTARTLIDLTITTGRRGSLHITDKYRSYYEWVYCGYRHVKADYRRTSSVVKVCKNGPKGF